MTISTSHNFDTDRWHLYVTNYNRTEVAGPRIFRAPPHPDIAFEHDTREAAEADARKLQEYLNALPVAKKKKSKDKSAYD